MGIFYKKEDKHFSFEDCTATNMGVLAKLAIQRACLSTYEAEQAC